LQNNLRILKVLDFTKQNRKLYIAEPTDIIIYGLLMKKEGKEKDQEFIPRFIIIIIVLLLLVPTVFVIFCLQNNGKINVGIVLANDELVEVGEVTETGLDDFHDIFSAKIVDIRFNESAVRVRDGRYLTDDYFNKSFSKEIRDEYDMDIVVIITDKLINNWLGNGYAAWGQADTESGVAMFTISPVRYNMNFSENYIISTSRHEVLHLLGYHHPQDDRDCLMRYASTEKELCGEYEMVLPYNVVLWRLGAGLEPGRATFVIRAAFLLLFSPIFVVFMIIAQFLFKKFIYRREKIDNNPLIYGIGALYITLFLAVAIFVPVYPHLILLTAMVFLYVIMEVRSYEKHIRAANTEIGE
jgi:hypothetical protein